jgi:hypothetical protein
VISTSSSANWEFGDGIGYAKKPAFPAQSRLFWELGPNAGMAGWGGRYRTWSGDFELGRSRLFERGYRTPVSMAFISLSKHSNLENRTESAESRAQERNGPFGEERADFAD